MFVDFWTVLVGVSLAVAVGVIVGAWSVLSVGLAVARYQARKERGTGTT